MYMCENRLIIYSIKRMYGYQTTIDGYNSPIINGYSRGKMESCYIVKNIVYKKCRINGYWIVLIDGYDRPRTKCQGTAKNGHRTGTHFATINCCKKIFTIGNS
jgi:hypothetical protein